MNKQVLEQEIKMWTAQRNEIDARIKANQEQLNQMIKEESIGKVVLLNVPYNDGDKRYLLVNQIRDERAFGKYIRLNSNGTVTTSSTSYELSKLSDNIMEKDAFMALLANHIKENLVL